jgi:hypothetical protein
MVHKKHDLVDACVVVRHETPAAVLVDHGGKAPVWLPKSKIELEPNADGRTHTVSLPQWLAEEKGIV